MPNKNYVNGANYERRIANKLRQEGMLVIRSAGSKSLWDLIAIDFKLGNIKLIQIKKYKLSRPELGKMKDEIDALGAQPCAEVGFYVVEHTRRGTDRMTRIR